MAFRLFSEIRSRLCLPKEKNNFAYQFVRAPVKNRSPVEFLALFLLPTTDTGKF